MTISRWIFLEWEMFQKRCRENQNTHLTFSNFFPKIVPFMRECRKIWWSQQRQMAKWRRVACWISKTTRAHAHTHALAPTRARKRTEICNTALPQQWSRERASMLRYTYTAYLFILRFTQTWTCFSDFAGGTSISAAYFSKFLITARPSRIPIHAYCTATVLLRSDFCKLVALLYKIQLLVAHNVHIKFYENRSVYTKILTERRAPRHTTLWQDQFLCYKNGSTLTSTTCTRYKTNTG